LGAAHQGTGGVILSRAALIVVVVLATSTSTAYAQQPSVVEQFRAGYEARAMGDPYLLGLEDHVTYDVLPCENGYLLDSPPPHLGLAQFSPDTWAKARRSEDADYRDPWEVGYAVASWLALIEDPGSRAGWPTCWWRW
jgi:hypothetical protein